MEKKTKKDVKIFVIIVVFVFTLIALKMFVSRHYLSIIETYYETTGKIVEDKIIWSASIDGSLLPAPNTNPEYKYLNKEICLAKSPHSNCAFIQASVVWDVTQFDGNANITCTYGCPK